jgi:hypothetical protein
MKPDLTHIELEVWDDEIIITLPGTSYIVTYYKPANSPQLLANFPYDDDGRTEITQAEFLASAWRLANDKARELRWIMQKNDPRAFARWDSLRLRKPCALRVVYEDGSGLGTISISRKEA